MSRRNPVTLPITKLRPPPGEIRQLARPALLARLSAVRSHRLALVVAPTGSGKTTLLAETCRCLAAEGMDTAWLTLDRCEGVPRYFLDHLAIAIQQTHPLAGREALAMLQGDNAAPETVIGSLINDLTEAETPLTLFLDDFQEADTPEVAGLIIYLLRYLPANVHVVIASQRDFPLSTSWARARHWGIELGWDDLRLNHAEIRSYLQETRSLMLSELQVSELASQTEGWACALQLAAIALEQQLTKLPRQTGSDFADALLDDLFGRQPADLQQFLRDTSILSRLCPALCDAVTNSKASREQLNGLESAHFFVQRLSPEGEWLRYHNLFSSFLRKRLRAADPERAALLHRRAGDWYVAHQQINEALNHWLAAGAVEPAAALLVSHGQTLLRNAEMVELENWLRRLPAQTVAASPQLATLYAWCGLHTGRPLAIRAALDDAQRAARRHPESTPPTLADEWTLLRALAGITRYDCFDSAGIDATLPQVFGAAQPVQRAFAHVIVAYVRRAAGDLRGAWSYYREACDLADANALLSVNYIARYGLAMVELLRAQPERALASLQEFFADPRRRAYWRTGGAAFLRTAQAHALMDEDRLDEAKNALDEAVTVLENTGAYGFYGVALTLRARLHAIEGRNEAAFADLQRARTSAMPNRISRTLFRADLCEAWMRLRRGELGKSERLLSQALEVLVESQQDSGENVESWQLMHCDWLLAAHRPSEAEAFALSAENAARAAGRQRSVVDFLLLRAIALQAQPGGIALGGACLKKARELAATGNLRLPFRLLASALAPLAASVEAEPPPSTGSCPGAILHQREAQVVRLLEQGLRNKDIAARLFLSEETVKWYLKRLYDNFEVGNRVQLLARVRKLGLLGESVE